MPKKSSFNLKLLALSFLLLALSVKPVYAQVNLGDKWNEQNFREQAQKLGAGGTITIMATPTDYKRLQNIFSINDSLGAGKVKVVIRSYKAGQAFTVSDAKSMAATLGSIRTSSKITWMPWNEPNDYDIESQGVPRNQLAERVALVQQAAYDSLRSAGLSGKVTLLSPMFNLYDNFAGGNDIPGHADAKAFVKEVKDAASRLGFNFMEKLDGWAVNWYADPGNSTNVGGQYILDYLNDLGVPIDKKIWGVETGTFENGKVTYNVKLLESFLTNFYQRLSQDKELARRLAGFSIFAYDPLGDKRLYLFQAQSLYNIFAQMRANNLFSPTEAASFDEVAFKAWLATAGIIECKDKEGNFLGFAPTENECKSYLSSTPYSQDRTVDGSNEVSIAYSDPVKLTQTAKINSASGPKTYTRGGFFEQFEDNTIPFVKKTLEYLGGPFVSELGDKEKVRLLVNNPKIEEAGVFSRLAPLYIQNKLRTQFRENCVKRIYTENECFILDPDNKELVDIADINPPPKLDTSLEYTKWSEEKNNTLRWYSIPLFANPDTLVKRAVTINACPPGINVDPMTNKETTADSRVPLVSSLKDVSTELNKMLIPQGASSKGVSLAVRSEAKDDQQGDALRNNSEIIPPVLAQNPPPKPQDNSNFNPFVINFKPEVSQIELTKYEVCWEINPRTQDSNYNWCDWGYRVNVSVNDKLAASFEEPILGGHCFSWNPSIRCTMGSAHPLIVSAEKAEDIKVGLQITSGRCTGKECANIDFRTRFGTSVGPGQPSCILPSVGGKNPRVDEDPVLITGHALLREPHKDLSCKNWENPGTPNEKCADGDTEYKVEDPVWAEIKYPFIATIHNFLAGKTGIFNIFRPPDKERDRWYEPAESKISYCLTDHPADSMIKGGSLEIYNKNFDKPDSRCDKNLATKTLGAYPPLLGGIDNAREWIFNMFKASKQKR